MNAFTILCMATERGQWKIWLRVFFVPLVWIIHGFLLAPLVYAAIQALAYFSPSGLAPITDMRNPVVDILASGPIIWYAARQSRLFVEPVETPESANKRKGAAIWGVAVFTAIVVMLAIAGFIHDVQLYRIHHPLAK